MPRQPRHLLSPPTSPISFPSYIADIEGGRGVASGTIGEKGGERDIGSGGFRSSRLPRSKHWSPDHVYLGRAVAVVREVLRRMGHRLGGHDGAELAACAALLTAGLKGRGTVEREGGPDAA
jgi:hypothetical protein